MTFATPTHAPLETPRADDLTRARALSASFPTPSRPHHDFQPGDLRRAHHPSFHHAFQVLACPSYRDHARARDDARGVRRPSSNRGRPRSHQQCQRLDVQPRGRRKHPHPAHHLPRCLAVLGQHREQCGDLRRLLHRELSLAGERLPRPRCPVPAPGRLPDRTGRVACHAGRRHGTPGPELGVQCAHHQPDAGSHRPGDRRRPRQRHLVGSPRRGHERQASWGVGRQGRGESRRRCRKGPHGSPEGADRAAGTPGHHRRKRGVLFDQRAAEPSDRQRRPHHRQLRGGHPGQPEGSREAGQRPVHRHPRHDHARQLHLRTGRRSLCLRQPRLHDPRVQHERPPLDRRQSVPGRTDRGIPRSRRRRADPGIHRGR